jgi:hypothetical protein
MATTTIRITHAKAGASLGAVNKLAGMNGGRAREACLALADLFTRIAAGMEPATVEIQLGGTTAVRASQTVSLGSVAGSVGATIGGTLVTVVTSGGAAGTIGLLVTAINGNTTVNKKCYAVATGAAQITLYAVSPGVNGNAITTVASGTGMTVGGATLLGGAGDDVVPVSYTRS